MTNRSYVAGLAPRSGLAHPDSQIIHFPLHEQEDSGNADLIVDHGNTSLFPDGVDVTGTATSMWSVDGAFTPPGDQDLQIQDSAVSTFFNLSTLDSVGGMGYLFDVFITSNPSGSAIVVLDYGHGDSTSGGMRIKIDSGGNVAIDVRDFGNVEGVTSMTAGSLSTGTWHSVAFYIDCANPTNRSYGWLDNVQGNAQDIPGALPQTTSRGLGIFNRRSSEAAVDQQMGGSSEGSSIRNLRVIRFEADRLADFSSVVAEAQHYGNERRLRTLVGL